MTFGPPYSVGRYLPRMDNRSLSFSSDTCFKRSGREFPPTQPASRFQWDGRH